MKAFVFMPTRNKEHTFFAIVMLLLYIGIAIPCINAERGFEDATGLPYSKILLNFLFPHFLHVTIYNKKSTSENGV